MRLHKQRRLGRVVVHNGWLAEKFGLGLVLEAGPGPDPDTTILTVEDPRCDLVNAKHSPPMYSGSTTDQGEVELRRERP